MKKLRIAFLTFEFVTEWNSGGGLGNYLNRITKALRELGHEPEVFTLSREEAGVIVHEGTRVERVHRHYHFGLRAVRRLWKEHCSVTSSYYALSIALAKALQRREFDAPFDFVQSSNMGMCGYHVPSSRHRPHLVRLSGVRDLWRKTDDAYDVDSHILDWYEKRCVQGADVAYAPSQAIAKYMSWKANVPVRVVRPPVFLEAQPSPDPCDMPPRYLVHFGQIGRRKGSDTLAEALSRAWREAPDLTMVLAGREIRSGSVARYQQQWGSRANQVLWLGPTEKSRLYAIVQSAEASVLPSVVDNLPNTVIESLMLGVPVIGTIGTSVDELVEQGRSGELVAVEDPTALADALVRVWRKQVPWVRSQFQRPAIFEQMEPRYAAERLIEAAGFANGRCLWPEPHGEQ